MIRTIPAVMATQHPDNVLAPFWHPEGDGFISALSEAKECHECFETLGVDEYMWDWEGKQADAAVVDRLLSNYHNFFAKKQLGRDIFLTFRLPNIWKEKGYSLIQAMTAILIAEDFGRDLGFKQRPLFEVILPMTERADQLMKMHELFEKLAKFKSKTFNGGQANTDYLELIPLIEGVDNQLNVQDLLEDYIDRHQRRFKKTPAYIRPFLARSDPAMASGLLATVLANKIALAQMANLSERQSIPIHPILGVGGLPFRGGLTPETADEFISNNSGVKTVTLQSSFRYDHPKQQAVKAVKNLEKSLPKARFGRIEDKDQKILTKIGKASEGYYQTTLGKVADDLTRVFQSVPRRRERRLHIGLLAYQRAIGKLNLPRAITFTCGFYSVGIPPEFIGMGRTLADLSESQLNLLLDHYQSLLSDLERAGRYLNKNNLTKLAKRNKAWRDIQKDIEMAESVLGLKFGPRSYSQHAHANLSANVLLAKNNQKILPGLIIELAQLRKSLG